MRRLVLIFAVLSSSSTLAQALQCNAWGRCWETEDPDEEIEILGGLIPHQHHYQPHYYHPYYYHHHHHHHDDEGEDE